MECDHGSLGLPVHFRNHPRPLVILGGGDAGHVAGSAAGKSGLPPPTRSVNEGIDRLRPRSHFGLVYSGNPFLAGHVLVVGQLKIAGLFNNEPDAPARANRCRK